MRLAHHIHKNNIVSESKGRDRLVEITTTTETKTAVYCLLLSTEIQRLTRLFLCEFHVFVSGFIVEI